MWKGPICWSTCDGTTEGATERRDYFFSLVCVEYLKVTIIYGDDILRIGGIAHFARIKFCAYAACASGYYSTSRASASVVRAQETA